MDEPLLTTVGSLLWLVGGVSGASAFVAYLAGRWIGRRDGADERTLLRLELQLANQHRPDVPFVDLAGEYGLLDPQEVLG